MDNLYDLQCLQECLTCWLRRVDQVDKIGRPLLSVQMSLFLYSERCISEVILDEMENLDDPIDNKRTILLSTICTAVSSDDKNIKILAKVLSEFEETRELANKLLK